jgi:hypothetical protein
MSVSVAFFLHPSSPLDINFTGNPAHRREEMASRAEISIALAKVAARAAFDRMMMQARLGDDPNQEVEVVISALILLARQVRMMAAINDIATAKDPNGPATRFLAKELLAVVADETVAERAAAMVQTAIKELERGGE